MSEKTYVLCHETDGNKYKEVVHHFEEKKYHLYSISCSTIENIIELFNDPEYINITKNFDKIATMDSKSEKILTIHTRKEIKNMFNKITTW